jgi:hypothetical protein
MVGQRAKAEMLITRRNWSKSVGTWKWIAVRRVADHLLEKDQVENDVLDAVIARISASRDTRDGYLADGLAWLCKVILKSGQVKYKETMADLSQAAGHGTLRKYARQAAEGLNS